MRVNFYLKDMKVQGETLIYCLLRYQNLRVKHYTNRRISPKYWNTKDQSARKSYPNSTELNHWLKSIQTHVDNIELEWTRLNANKGVVPVIPPSHFKKRLDDFFSKTTKEDRQNLAQKSFWGFYDKFIQRMKNGTRLHLSKNTPMSSRYISQFENLQRHLTNFERLKKTKIEFEDINLKFYNDFVDYLTIKLNLSANTIGKLITNLKVFLREAYDEGLSKNNIYNNRKFRSINVESETIYLTPLEINEILKLDLTHSPKLERVRDTFIIGCLTGLRFSDLINIKPENIIDGMIEITQKKTKEKVVIPIKNQVSILLEKYEFSMRKISTQKFNDYLYEIVNKCELLKHEVKIRKMLGGKLIDFKKPKYEFVTSHTARRSFATNEYILKDLSVREIMAITGHKTEKSFYKYIRQTPKENAERVKIIWREREESMDNNNLKVV